ncbi:MAG TPA: tRNA preQ1(34) S-adenosylmethionine ribosyltransferase-isomerase QueA [Longimicrobiales bacterium]|nr:tRNA preQ1(34) S-adenosylmethionine ribosyltransferase-isomerase QueA [Longimicrobiales bacterium]
MPERAPLTTSSFDYDLPPELIASYPATERDASRLLIVRRDRDTFEHATFRDIIDLFEPGDVLVLNETRVFPARLLGSRAGGGAAEIVLLHPAGETPESAAPGASGGRAGTNQPASDLNAAAWPREWAALVRPGARLRAGRTVRIADDLHVEILEVLADGTRRVRLNTQGDVRRAIERHGRMPLPPYIEREAEATDAERYQTVYARSEGSVAAPTAGLHFTPALLAAMRARGVEIARVVLHVGVGTFRPVEAEDPADHPMHEEWYEVTEAEAVRMNAARRAGGRLWAVGTTVTRTLESAADEAGVIQAGSGWTRLFIRPGYDFKAVDALITNFHLPRSTLLMLVSAFAGYERTRAAYDEAIRERYRFYSYGDAMAIL